MPNFQPGVTCHAEGRCSSTQTQYHLADVIRVSV